MIDVTNEIREYKAYLTLKNFKTSTVKAYYRTLQCFYEYKHKHYGDEVPTQQHVQDYLLERREAGKSWSTINVDYSSLRKYFKELKDYEWSLKKLPRPKRDDRLPDILSKEEIARLIEAAPTLKYQVFLTVLYTTGVRLSEATGIKLSGIDSDRMQISIREGNQEYDIQVKEILNSEREKDTISMNNMHNIASFTKFIEPPIFDLNTNANLKVPISKAKSNLLMGLTEINSSNREIGQILLLANFHNSDFRHLTFSDKKFRWLKSENSNFTGTILSDVDFRQSILNGSSFIHSWITKVNFSGAKMSRVNFMETHNLLE